MIALFTTRSFLLMIMLFSSKVWAVYGIGLEGPKGSCTTRACASIPTTANITVVSPFGTPLPANTSASDVPTTLAYHTNHFSELSVGAKAGIITGASVVVLIVFLVVLEVTYLRRKRRERALRRAVEEVERGSRRTQSDGMDESGVRKEESGILDNGIEQAERKSHGEVHENVDSEREGMVLESKVEIVVVDEGGWEIEEWGRGRERTRCAMSLPRSF